MKNKKAIINIKNNDKECFKWSVTRALHMRERDNERIDKLLKKQTEKYKWDGVNFPATFYDIDKFERNNKIGVVLFGGEQTEYRDKETGEIVDEIIILRTPKEKYSKEVQLL